MASCKRSEAIPQREFRSQDFLSHANTYRSADICQRTGGGEESCRTDLSVTASLVMRLTFCDHCACAERREESTERNRIP